MSFPKIKESELKALLDEVATDLSKAFESEKDKLVKAEGLAKDDAPGEEPDESPAPDASAPPDASPAPSPEEGSEAPAPDASASPDGAPAPDAPMDPAADAAAALTPEALQAEYSKLAPEELDMHLKAALAAKAAVAGAPDASAGAPPMGAGAPPDASASAGAPPMGAPAGAPPAGPPAPAMAPPSPPMPDDPMALKSEVSAGTKKANGGQIKAGGSLGKSENEKQTDDKIAALEALVKSQGEDNENLAKAIKLMIEQPLRKAVTSVAHLPKVEAEKAPLTKASINARLKELSMKPDLKKSDRALINDFYDGRVKADALAPLFEDYK